MLESGAGFATEAGEHLWGSSEWMVQPNSTYLAANQQLLVSAASSTSAGQPTPGEIVAGVGLDVVGLAAARGAGIGWAGIRVPVDVASDQTDKSEWPEAIDESRDGPPARLHAWLHSDRTVSCAAESYRRGSRCTGGSFNGGRTRGGYYSPEAQTEVLQTQGT